VLAVVDSVAELSLQKLNISWNSMGEIGAINVADSLKKFKFLIKLNVGYNGLGKDGFEAIKNNTKHMNVSITNE